MERPQYSEGVSTYITRVAEDIVYNLHSQGGDLVKIKTLMLLVSDILFNSVQSTEAWSYLRHFEKKMPLLML